MAWEWSHTGEAYHNARKNLMELDRHDLIVIYAEWHACRKDEYGIWDSGIFRDSDYQDAVHNAHDKSHSELYRYIWNRMVEYRTCDNGGYNAWACPYGCHTVSFDKEDKNE